MSCTPLDHPRFGPCLSLASDDAHVLVRLQGGQVLSWHARSRQRLFVPDPQLASGPALRGGVPVIFPQFADQGPGPRHGFARTVRWTAYEAPAREGAIVAGLRLSGAGFDPCWPHAFTLELELALTADTLEFTLVASNDGDQPWSFTAALHTYLAISAPPGLPAPLADLAFQDRSDSGCRSPAAGPLEPEAEIERLYRSVPTRLEWRLPDTLRMHSEGWPDLMVWNPGPAKATALTDLAPGDHRRFLCVEPLQFEPHALAPGARWRAVHTLRVTDA